MIAWHEWRRYWHKRMPILDWLPKYSPRRDLKADMIAGFTVAVMLVPQEMSLAALMGVPAQYGLYTAATAPLLYPLFGSSRVLSVANASEGSLLVGVMLRVAEIRTMEERVATGILLTFFTGVIMIISGLLHQGGVVSFFSRTSMHGYITATAFLIITSQLPGWFGVPMPSGRLTIFTLFEIFASMGSTNIASLVLGILSMILLTLGKKLKKQLEAVRPLETLTTLSSSEEGRDYQEDTLDQEEGLEEVDLLATELQRDLVRGSRRASVAPTPPPEPSDKPVHASPSAVLTTPSVLQIYLEDKPRVLFLCKLFCDGSALVVCMLGMLVGKTLGEDHLKLTGDVHRGLPTPVFPPAALGSLVPWSRLQSIVLNAAMISLVFFMSSVATGSNLARKGGYEISPNQELFGLGFANLGASFFQGMPSSGALSRSAVNSQSAHTPLASMITACLVIITLLFLTGPLYYLPQAPLAALIMLSAVTLVDFSEPKWLRVVRRHELYVWLAAFFGTLTCGLLRGIAISIAASLFAVMARSKKPRVFALGQRSDGTYTDAESPGMDAIPLLDVVLVRMEHALYCGNASHFIHGIQHKLDGANTQGRVLGVVVDGSRMNDVDASAIHALKEYAQKLRDREQHLTFANLRTETAESLLASGLWEDPRVREKQRLTQDLDAAISCLRAMASSK
ncbi:hypothetical protein Poli38472_011883 [Pythium oligandrum]|uniref:STAS domain-containing protein n=1 Tax=Pythium oligandrum TaxID=41045 RepID=A0A8K1C8M3_PYTOL|nr:hypothetical protein Poli38472_011883 [Pythium oligandrum]|eukprot:TMW58295.1 hypothetical protein Poli38472_011883 [Pythium oligandrum]